MTAGRSLVLQQSSAARAEGHKAHALRPNYHVDGERVRAERAMPSVQAVVALRLIYAPW